MIAILHNIRSLHNVGSIFRTADGVGVKKIYLTGYTPKPVDAFGKTRGPLSKVSLGAELFVPWEKQLSVSKVIRGLKTDGYKIWAIEQADNSIPYSKIKPDTNKNVLIVGNEVRGLTMGILKLADQILEIPMHGQKESLNVSVAFGIVAYHFAK